MLVASLRRIKYLVPQIYVDYPGWRSAVTTQSEAHHDTTSVSVFGFGHNDLRVITPTLPRRIVIFFKTVTIIRFIYDVLIPAVSVISARRAPYRLRHVETWNGNSHQTTGQ